MRIAPPILMAWLAVLSLPVANAQTLSSQSVDSLNVAHATADRNTWNLAQDVGGTGNQLAFDQGAAGVWYFMTSRCWACSPADGKPSAPPHDPHFYRLIREYHAPDVAWGESWNDLPQERSCWQEETAREPNVCYNDFKEPREFAMDIPPLSVQVHPGPDTPVIVAWKSPVRGVVSVSGVFADSNPCGADGVSWYIDRRSQTLASGTVAEGGRQTFRLRSVSVDKNTVLYFGVLANGSYFCDTTLLDVTISRHR